MGKFIWIEKVCLRCLHFDTYICPLFQYNPAEDDTLNRNDDDVIVMKAGRPDMRHFQSMIEKQVIVISSNLQSSKIKTNKQVSLFSMKKKSWLKIKF